ncbi:MAG: glycosyltransferase family 2 protein [Gammaproteobacteria bacterium]|nr:glycosyltransferase family 2 protein [Gammaproteobacteria bacterium]
MSAIFWFSALMLFYVFLGYPLLLLLWARLRSRPAHKNFLEPFISVLMVVRNEEATLRNKLLNLRDMDYPQHKVEIVVVSDASTDDTDRILAEFESQGVIARKALSQRGKPSNLNECIPELRGEIVILMDARQSVEPEFARALIRNFNDPQVGAVSGELVLAPVALPMNTSSSAASGVGFYWRYEKFLRRMESRIDSSVGATGALYAIRKSLFQPIAPDSLLDDMLIPMNIVRQGYRVIFEPDAVATDAAAISASSEFRRKVRTIAGNFQLFSRETWLLNPFVNRLWIQTISHKFLRLTAPLFLMLIMISNFFLIDSTFYLAVLVVQLLFYAAALGGRISESRNTGVRAFTIPYAFCVLNWATVIGFIRFVFRQQQVMWK